MLSKSLISLFFVLAEPGQKLGDWQAPKVPGVYPLEAGKTALVGVKPDVLWRRANAIGHYPDGAEPILIPLRPRDRDVKLSAHFKIGDFLCKGDRDVLAVSPKLVTKLEVLIGELNREGYACDGLSLMSGYRTPSYNKAIGNSTTRSRHTHGDAADVLASDLNRDGRIDRRDAEILFSAVNKLDKDPDLRGGASMYPPNGSHGWFVHTDTRGKLARW